MPSIKSGDELRIVALLARVESQVLEQLDAGRQLGESLPDRLHRILRVGLALRPTEVRGTHNMRAATGEPLDRRQRGADAEIVDDLAVVDGHIEIGTDQHSLAGHITEIGERGDAAHFRFLGILPPTYNAVSTRRLE